MDNHVCILCTYSIFINRQALINHYQQCSAQNKAQYRCLNARLVINRMSICFRCGQAFQQKQWQIHSRRCSNKANSRQIHFDVDNNSQKALTYPTSGYSIGPSESFSRNLANIIYQFTLANTPLWLALNPNVSTKNLSTFFMNKIGTQVGQILTTKVPVITQNQIKRLHMKALKNVKPEQLANSVFVDNLIPKLSPHNHLKLVTFLNKKAKETGNFQIRPLPKISREKKQFKPAKFLNMMKFLAVIVCSGKKYLTHIGIDLLIIFQTGVRFISDHKLLQRQIIENKAVIYLDINKTSKMANIVLPPQTRQLIKLFEWRGWSPKTLKLYQNMRSWAGMRGYTLKYTILSFIYLIQPRPKEDTSQTGHVSFFGILPYVKFVQGQLTRDELKNTQIPGVLNSENNWDNIEKINSLFKGVDDAYEQICPQYLKNLISLIYRNEKQYSDDTYTKITTVGTIHPFHKNVKQKIDIDNEKEMEIEQQNSNSSQQPEYLIYGQQEPGNFESRTYFTKQGVRLCVFCQKSYQPPLCNCLKIIECKPLRSIPGKWPLQIDIHMPEQYFNKQYDSNYLDIRRLLALRRFIYTQQATCTYQSFDVDASQKASWENPKYKRLRKQCYFPPIKLIKSGQKFLSFEDSFGLVAQQQIPQNTFLGQYAADLISLQYVQCMRRPDTFIRFDCNQQRLLITPVLCMGYICLLNCSRQKEANCSYIKVQVNGQSKIIVYTTKKIIKDDELLCQYEQYSRLTTTTTLIVPIAPISSTAPISSAAIQKLKKKTHKKGNIVQLPIKHRNQCFVDVLYEVFRQIYKQLPEQLTNRERIIQNFLGSHGYQQFTQQDSVDFFTYTQQILKESVFKIQMELEYECGQCGCQKISEVPQYFCIVDKGKRTRTQYEDKIEDYNCSVCQKRTHGKVKGHIVELNQYICFVHQRMNSKGYMDHIVHCPTKLMIKQNLYQIWKGILFLGSDNQGHYVVKNKIQGNDRSRIYFCIYKLQTLPMIQ